MLLLQECHQIRGNHLASLLHSGTAWSWWGCTPSPALSAGAQTHPFLQTEKEQKEGEFQFQSETNAMNFFNTLLSHSTKSTILLTHTWFLSSQLMTSLHLSRIFCLSSSLIFSFSFSSSTVDFMLKAYDSRPFLAATLSLCTSSSALYFSASWTIRSMSSLLRRPEGQQCMDEMFESNTVLTSRPRCKDLIIWYLCRSWLWSCSPSQCSCRLRTHSWCHWRRYRKSPQSEEPHGEQGGSQ